MAPPRPRRFIVVYGEPGEGGHSGGRLTELAASTHVREIEANAYPGVPHFERDVDEARLVAVNSVATMVRAVQVGNVAYYAYFGHAGITPGPGQDHNNPRDPLQRTGQGALYPGEGATPGANLTSRGHATDRPATDFPRAKFARDAQVRLFGCRAGLGHPPLPSSLPMPSRPASTLTRAAAVRSTPPIENWDTQGMN